MTRHRSTALAVLGAAVLALATWPPLSLGIGAGTDPSWVAGIHMAAHLGLDFGRDVAYTYGPLGWLSVPRLSYPDQGLVSFLFAVGWQLALAVGLLLVARRSFGWVGAALVTLGTLALLRLIGTDNVDFTQISVSCAVLLGALAALRRAEAEPGPAGRWVLWAAAAGGVVTALTLLMKLNTGLVILGVTGVVALVLDRERPWRPVAAFAAALAVSGAALWAVARQSLGTVDDYVRSSLEVISGHAEALQAEDALHLWEYPGAALVSGVVLTAAWFATDGWSARRRAAMGIALAGFGFAAFKQGFIRHDLVHALQFFVPMLVAGIAVAPPRGRIAWLTVGTLLLATVASARLAPPDLFTPRASWTSFETAVNLLGRADSAIRENRGALTGQLQLDPETRRLLRGRTVHVHPLEASTAWAVTDLRWRPLPVFQAYVAHTPALDDLNADLLRSDRAPERILRTAEFNPFESPRTMLTMLCHYRELHTAGGWQVLARTGNRCGPRMRRLSVLPSATSNPPFELPDPPSDDELVVMRLKGLGKDTREKLRSLLIKPYNRLATFDSADRGRFIQALFERGVVARVPRERDYSGRFRIDFPAETLGLSLTRQIQAEAVFEALPFEIEFLALPIRETGRLPARSTS